MDNQMSGHSFKIPILFLIFNRPATTKVVFEKIRQIQPQYLYIAADGPRTGNASDKQLCTECRAIIQQIDWDCKLQTLFRDENLGCKNAISSAIDWFFENEEMGIILEDDCVPDLSFFPFCEDLLNFYKDDPRIIMISGDKFYPFKRIHSQQSYYFSRYPHIWGWASWRRAWKYYDVNLTTWPEIKENINLLYDVLGKWEYIAYWFEVFTAVHLGRIQTWDFQWTYACWKNSGLSIVPAANLVKNIGFGADATHTQDSNSTMAKIHTSPMNFPLKHPSVIKSDIIADNYIQRHCYENGSRAEVIKLKIKSIPLWLRYIY